MFLILELIKLGEDRDNLLFKYVKGVKIAFIDYTDSVNSSVPSEQDFCVNLINKDLIKKDIDSAKSQNSDIIVACMNWKSNQSDLTNFLFENGVDIVLGNSSNSLGPMEKRSVTLANGDTKDCFVVYSLGNFMSSQVSSIILNLRITKHVDSNKISIDDINYIPVYMFQDNSLSIKKYKLLDIKKLVDEYDLSINSGLEPAISQSFYNTLKLQLQNIDNSCKLVNNN